MKGTGLDKNSAGALSYVLGPITGVIFLILEKDPFVRFHAMQSIVVFSALFVLQWATILTLLLIWASPLIGVASFVLWLILIYKAWQGEQWEVPVLGKVARQFLGKVK